MHMQDLLDGGGKITWINAGVADKSGVLPFTIAYRDDSSTFAPTQANAGARTIPISVKTINEIVSASSATLPEVVKIDAEGFDLKVLAGASDLLGKTDIFFVEVTIWPPGSRKHDRSRGSHDGRGRIPRCRHHRYQPQPPIRCPVAVRTGFLAERKPDLRQGKNLRVVRLGTNTWAVQF